MLLAQGTGWQANPDIVRKASPQGFNYEESKVGPYALPDPLAATDGRIHTVDRWRKRRAEILELFRTNVYGRVPPVATRSHFDVSEDKSAMSGAATLERVTISTAAGQREHHFELTRTSASRSSSRASPVKAVRL